MNKIEYTFEHVDPADGNWIGPTRIYSANEKSVIRAVRKRTGHSPRTRIWHNGHVIARLIRGSETLHIF